MLAILILFLFVIFGGAGYNAFEFEYYEQELAYNIVFGVIGGLLFIAAVVYIVMSFIKAKQLRAMAEAKGHYGKRYYNKIVWWGLLKYKSLRAEIEALPDLGTPFVVDVEAEKKAARKKLIIIVTAVLFVFLFIVGAAGGFNHCGSGSSGGKTKTCNYCHGSGRVDGSSCPWCGGSGKTYDNYFNDILD